MPARLVVPFVFGFVMRERFAFVALRRYDGLDIGASDLFANGVSIIALVGEELLDPVENHPEQKGKA